MIAGTSTHFQRMYDDGSSADVLFEVTDGTGHSQAINAHKIVLGSASPVFKAMFDSSFLEGQCPEAVGNGATTIVSIEAKSTKSFELMCRYIYGFEIPHIGDDWVKLGLIDLIEQYELNEIKEQLQDIFQDSLNLGTMGKIFSLVQPYSSWRLRDVVFNCLLQCTHTVLELKMFLCFDAEDMKDFLAKSMYLTESYRLKILNEWTLHRKGSDDECKKLYSLIRYDGLTAESLKGVPLAYCSVGPLHEALLAKAEFSDRCEGRNAQSRIFLDNQAFELEGNGVTSRAWSGFYWGWTVGACLSSKTMASLPVDIQGANRVRIGFWFQFPEGSSVKAGVVVYYDFEDHKFHMATVEDPENCFSCSSRKNLPTSGPTFPEMKRVKAFFEFDWNGTKLMQVHIGELQRSLDIQSSTFVKKIPSLCLLDSSRRAKLKPVCVKPFLECYDQGTKVTTIECTA